MFNINLNFLFNFNERKKKKEAMKKVIKASEDFEISILPIDTKFDLENLYPITKVNNWNVFIVGNTKTYILLDTENDIVQLNKNEIVNTQGKDIPTELFLFLDKIWDETLLGNNLQFFIILKNKFFLINTYYFKNSNGKVIGAILFMRNFNTNEIN
jgi:hypothetical protein